jgi:predicted porin
MNKKLINLAVAAAIAAPAAAMADATLYGVINQSIDYIDQDDFQVFNPETGLNETPPGGEGFSGWAIDRTDGRIIGFVPLSILLPPAEDRLVQAVLDQVSIGNGPVGPSNRVGVKGSEDLGNGLKAIYQIEFGVSLADGDFAAVNGDRGDGFNLRNTFAGLAGNWGTFLVGRHDSPLKISTGKLDMFADTMADYNGALAFSDLRLDNAVAYISPSWSGFQFAGAVHAGGKATVEGIPSTASDSLAEGWSVAGIYSNGPWYASAAYESLNSDLGYFATLANDLFAENLLPEPFDDWTKYRFGLGMLDWNGFSLTGIYEHRDNEGFFSDYDTQSWEIQAGYAFGNNMVKAAYGQRDRDLDASTIRNDVEDVINDVAGIDVGGDLNQWTIAFDHNFSKRTKVYALYNAVDDDFLPNWDGFSLGLVHKF